MLAPELDGIVRSVPGWRDTEFDVEPSEGGITNRRADLGLRPSADEHDVDSFLHDLVPLVQHPHLHRDDAAVGIGLGTSDRRSPSRSFGSRRRRGRARRNAATPRGRCRAPNRRQPSAARSRSR